jgi:hypothetical protein
MHSYLKKTLLASALLVALALALTPMAAFAAPYHPVCDPGWIFDSVHGTGYTFKAVTPVYGQVNRLKHNITVTLTATTTGTVTFTSGDTTGVGLNFEFVQVQANVNSQVSYSISTTVGHAVSTTLAPGQGFFGQYGVERQSAAGHLYYLDQLCRVMNDHGWVTTYSPWYATWNLWS